MVKLALVIPGFQASEDDWCIPAFSNLARALATTAEVHVYALRYPHAKRDYKVGMVHVHALGAGSLAGKHVRAASLLKLWGDTLKSISREHKRRPFSAVCGMWATESGYLSTLAAARAGVPALVHLAGGELVQVREVGYGNRGVGLSGLLVSRSLARATLLTVPSSAVATALPPTVPEGKTRAWALGVDTDMFRPEERGRQPKPVFTFVAVGSLIPVKDHEWMLKALALLNSSLTPAPVRLIVAGTGPLHHRLETLAAQLGIAESVRFLGNVAHEDLPAVYRSADACVVSSWHEAQCMALLEGMACGLPWVGPPVGAISDLIAREPQTGLPVYRRTPEALAAALSQMVSLPTSVRHAYGQQARGHVLESYDYRKQAERLLALLTEITV